jgi:hypothetical protein
MKTIAQQLNVKKFPFEIHDSNRNKIYYENSDGSWIKREYDSSNNQIHYENSDGFWEKREYDSSNNQIYYENSYGSWENREYDSSNNQIYYENSYGVIRDNRVIPEYTIEELQKMLGKEFKIIK